MSLQEHPADEAWVKLDLMITPLLLNYCQCQLLQGQYYEVIEHCSALLFKYEGEDPCLRLDVVTVRVDWSGFAWKVSACCAHFSSVS